MRVFFILVLLFILCRIGYPQQDPLTSVSQQDIADSAATSDEIKIKYQGIIEAGYSWGLGEWGQSTYRFVMVNALRISHYSIGIGFGFSKLDHDESEEYAIRFEYQVPLYLDNRFYLTRSGLQPYISFGAGVSFVNHQMVADVSPYLNATAGIFWKISDHVSLNAGVMCASYTIKYEEKYVGIFEHKSTTLGPFVGIAF
jgi:hypothetical protein